MTKGELRHYAKEHGVTLSEARWRIREYAKKNGPKVEQSARPFDFHGIDLARKLERSNDAVALLLVSPMGTVRFDITPKIMDDVNQKFKDNDIDLSGAEAAAMIGDAFRDGNHLRKDDGNGLCGLIIHYLSKTQSWQMVQMMGQTGMVITVLPLSPNGGAVRPGDCCIAYEHVEELYKEVSQDYDTYPEVIQHLMDHIRQYAKDNGLKEYIK